MITMLVTCPIDGLAIRSGALEMKGTLADVDGNFARDPTQHLDFIVDMLVSCVNGHHWNCQGALGLQRLPRLERETNTTERER